MLEHSEEVYGNHMYRKNHSKVPNGLSFTNGSFLHDEKKTLKNTRKVPLHSSNVHFTRTYIGVKCSTNNFGYARSREGTCEDSLIEVEEL
jgi:hypothetical protein